MFIDLCHSECTSTLHYVGDILFRSGLYKFIKIFGLHSMLNGEQQSQICAQNPGWYTWVISAFRNHVTIEEVLACGSQKLSAA
jgi:hypothetical protein